MASETTDQKQLTLQSSDGETFQVLEESIGQASMMIRGMLEDEVASDDVMVLPNVTGPVLGRVLEYVKAHFDDRANRPGQYESYDVTHADHPLQRFDHGFVQVDEDMLFDLIEAANYLSIPSLLDLMCKTVADELRGKTPEEIRHKFHIFNDYSKDEEEEVRRENSWAFE